jgi:hypothetical protein
VKTLRAAGIGAILLATACLPRLGRIPTEPGPALTTSVGDRIRVWHRSPCCTNPLIGAEDSVADDALWVRGERDNSRLAVPTASITRVDKWVRVRPPPAGKLYAVSVAAGAGFGLLLDVFMWKLSGDDSWNYHGRLVAGGAVIGLVAGTLFGALEDARWEAASIPSTR